LGKKIYGAEWIKERLTLKAPSIKRRYRRVFRCQGSWIRTTTGIMMARRATSDDALKARFM
jgi:hypothetical protein